MEYTFPCVQKVFVLHALQVELKLQKIIALNINIDRNKCRVL